MPRGDGTGPFGLGALTGRGAGYCAGFGTPGYTNTRVGRGVSFRKGRGYRGLFLLLGLLPGCAYLTCRFFNRNRRMKNKI